MSEQFGYDVFLSHSSKDKAVVRAVAERLRKDGVRVWFDEWEIKAGDSIPAKIEEGLEKSRACAMQIGQYVRPLGLGAVGIQHALISRAAERGPPVDSCGWTTPI